MSENIPSLPEQLNSEIEAYKTARTDRQLDMVKECSEIWQSMANDLTCAVSSNSITFVL